MEKLVCTSCGAPIDPKTGMCPYCGSRYRIELNRPEPIILQVENPRIQRIGARCRIPAQAAAELTPEQMREIAMDELTHSIAKCLECYMEFETRNDFRTDSIDVDGSVRIVPPGFRFI